MKKHLETAAKILLEAFEQITVALCAGAFIWFFGVMGITPRFEYQTSAYIALWFWVMFAVAYELYAMFEERLAAR